MREKRALTEYSRFGGCAAKIAPDLLDKALCNLEQPHYERVLSDFSLAEDCGVYKIDEKLALVQTVDFFPPVCDDPYMFGRIAAANALSDVYAMGAKPITALSIVCFPDEQLEISLLTEVMQGALSALIEAETALVGGHSIKDNELKFGLCINGVVDPSLMWRNNTWSDNQVLILTKAIGTGVLGNAVRAEVATGEEQELLLKQMGTLNKEASEVIALFNPSAATDVTGFGLLGHLSEMAQHNGVGVCIESSSVPLLGNVLSYIEMGLIPAGAYTNLAARSHLVKGFDLLSESMQYLLFDPQTSGGLLVAVDRDKEGELLSALKERGVTATTIGYTDTLLEGIVVH